MESILWSYLMPGLVQKDQYVLRTMLEEMDKKEENELNEALEAISDE